MLQKIKDTTSTAWRIVIIVPMLVFITLMLYIVLLFSKDDYPFMDDRG